MCKKGLSVEGTRPGMTIRAWGVEPTDPGITPRKNIGSTAGKLSA
jgi:hypothetical protein